MMLENEDDPSKMKERAKLVQAAAERMTRLIRDKRVLLKRVRELTSYRALQSCRSVVGQSSYIRNFGVVQSWRRMFLS